VEGKNSPVNHLESINVIPNNNEKRTSLFFNIFTMAHSLVECLLTLLPT